MQHQIDPAQQSKNHAARPVHEHSSVESEPLNPVFQLQQAGNQAVQELLRPGMIRAKLSISHPDDPEEREADQVAHTIMRAHAGFPASSCSCAGDEMCEECQRQAEGTIRRHANVPDAPAHVPQIVRDVIGLQGQPLDATARAFFEPQFGRDFSDVRVHTGADAAASARSLNANAYTAGSDIVFASGQYSPDTSSGRTLLAHELTHIVQQKLSGASLQRQPANPQAQQPAPAPAPERPWADVLEEFRVAKISYGVDRTRALAMNLEAAAAEDGNREAVMQDGMEVVDWLARHGETDAAGRLLETIRGWFRFTFGARLDFPGLTIFGIGSGFGSDPETLIQLGEDKARAGQDEEALRYFTAANEMLTFYALNAVEAPAETRGERYQIVETIYKEMREIYGFYYALEGEARAAGKKDVADEAHRRSEELRTSIHEKLAPFANRPAEVIEAELVKSSGRPGFRTFGLNKQETVLTELPGHPWPQELIQSGGGEQQEAIESLESVLMAQTDLQAELGREDAIREKYGKGPIDLNDTETRVTVWKIMFGVYQKSGADALPSLMDLIGRYLRAYTHHTEYNVRDFDPNYLDSPMPEDLAGRLERDCGVYAISVAWDLFETAKSSGGKLALTFRLATFLDHVTLIISDGRDAYLVNNDQIALVPIAFAGDCPPLKENEPGAAENPGPFCAPPASVDLEKEVAKQYSSLRNLPYLVTPVVYQELGKTGNPEKAFHDTIWERYKQSTGYMAKVPVTFGMQESFSKNAQILEERLDALAASPDFTTIVKWLGENWDLSRQLLGLFEHILNAFRFGGKTPPPEPTASYHTITFRSPREVHPLARVALLLLFFEHLGGSLMEEGRRHYLDAAEAWFKDAIDKHREAALGGQF